ncbi:MAG: TetR/AcrR family transcriptional regulator [Bradyrhizobiaceae bacterium]|nr:MAG: TetR/AcrR family transcriptional regulator [Bradyrhizobiaceae bacterium]
MRVRKPAEERKSEIVEATLRLADKVGPDRLATGQVAEAVGLTQAALFRHFPKKQDLWEAVAARIGEKFQQRWLAIERGPADPLDRLRGIVAAQLKLIQSMPAIPAILFSRELHVENRALRVIFAEFMKNFNLRIERLLAAAQRDGRLRGDIEPRDAAFLVIGLVQGLVLRWSVSGRSFDLPTEGERLLSIQLMTFGAAPAAGTAAPERESRERSAASGTVPAT